VLDQPPDPPPGVILPNLLKWEQLDSWRTPANNFFVVSHYNEPALKAADWRLRIGGLVARPRSLTLADLKARPRREVDFTLSARATRDCRSSSGASATPAGRARRWLRS
jgi:DMSO/TMAO reductase YedYZ molybdopterin-dependent catalytic subunit